MLAEINKIGEGEEENFCKGWPSGISVAAVKAGPKGGGGVAILVRDGALNWEADDEKRTPSNPRFLGSRRRSNTTGAFQRPREDRERTVMIVGTRKT